MRSVFICMPNLVRPAVAFMARATTLYFVLVSRPERLVSRSCPCHSCNMPLMSSWPAAGAGVATAGAATVAAGAEKASSRVQPQQRALRRL